MKAKWLVIPAAAAVLFSGSALAATPMPPLAKTSGCTACHNVDTKIVGPAWKDIAARYKGKAGIKATLVSRIKTGSVKKKRYWKKETGTGAPMPPYSPRVSDENIGKLVDFILGL